MIYIKNPTSGKISRYTLTCIQQCRKLSTTKVSSNACFTEGIVTEVTAKKITTIATPATLFIHAIFILNNFITGVPTVATLE